ncbi:uncharacterized protein LOC130452085, partial [Diorhabda sublineata]|uniref:uncharacterized protein LOC130452085 n=1 Tax=Diorhabda sublineata TaxID=1163346 RepID=UPI0024E13CFB
ILAITVATRAECLSSNVPRRNTYRNEKSIPFETSNINDGIIPTTTTPTELNSAFVSSTPSPLGFRSEYVSTLNQNSEYGDSNPALNLQNPNFNTFLVPQFVSGNPQLINIDTNSNSFAQQIPQRLGDYNSVTIESTTSGGSLNDAFGISEDVIETQKPEKSIYFFVAPRELEPIRPRIQFQKNKKKVNVVFIKAPSAPSLGTIEVTAPAQESPEKTIVYVLVKKPEEQQKIIVKPAPVVKPSKPEVVFIKYKDEEEAQQHINKVQAQHDAYIKNQEVGQEILNARPSGEYIPNLQANDFGTTTESTYQTEENEVNQQYFSNYRFDNVPLEYTTTTIAPPPVQFQTAQQQLIPNYNSEVSVQQTDSPLDDVTQRKSFNYAPLSYTTSTPQVSVNEFTNNENVNNVIAIGNKQSSVTTSSPFKRSWVPSNKSPRIGRPNISNFHLFFNKM